MQTESPPYHILGMYLEEFGFKVKVINNTIRLIAPSSDLIFELYNKLNSFVRIAIMFYRNCNEETHYIKINRNDVNLAIHILKYN